MRILSLDPGNEETGFVVYGTKSRKVLCFGILPNEELLGLIERADASIYAHCFSIEIIICYGQRIGMSTINTAKWIGRFEQAWKTAFNERIYEVRRPDVKTHVCYSAAATDAGVREALCDRYGGEKAAIGNKKNPGPLHGISKHVWSALAVAITVAETRLSRAVSDRRRISAVR